MPIKKVLAQPASALLKLSAATVKPMTFDKVGATLGVSVMKATAAAVPLQDDPSDSILPFEEMIEKVFAAKYHALPSNIIGQLEKIIAFKWKDTFGNFTGFRKNYFAHVKFNSKEATLMTVPAPGATTKTFEESDKLWSIAFNIANKEFDVNKSRIIQNTYFKGQSSQSYNGSSKVASQGVAMRASRQVTAPPEPPPPIEYQENASALATLLAQALAVESGPPPIENPEAVDLTEGDFYVPPEVGNIPGARPTIIIASNYVSPMERNSNQQKPFELNFSRQSVMRQQQAEFFMSDAMTTANFGGAYGEMGVTEVGEESAERLTRAMDKERHLNNFFETINGIGSKRLDFDNMLQGKNSFLNDRLKWEGYVSNMPVSAVLMQNLIDMYYYSNIGGLYPLTRTGAASISEAQNARKLGVNYKVNLSSAINTWPDPEQLSCAKYFEASTTVDSQFGVHAHNPGARWAPLSPNSTRQDFLNNNAYVSNGYHVHRQITRDFVEEVEEYFEDYSIPYFCQTLWVEILVSGLIRSTQIAPSKNISPYFTSTVLSKIKSQKNILAGLMDMDLVVPQLNKDVHDWTPIAMSGMPDLTKLIKYDQADQRASGPKFVYAFQVDDILQGQNIATSYFANGQPMQQSAGTAWVTPSILANIIGNFDDVNTGTDTEDNLISRDLIEAKFQNLHNIDLDSTQRIPGGMQQWMQNFLEYRNMMESATECILENGGGHLVYAAIGYRMRLQFVQSKTAPLPQLIHEKNDIVNTINTWIESDQRSILSVFNENMVLENFEQVLAESELDSDVFMNAMDMVYSNQSDIMCNGIENQFLSLETSILIIKILWHLNLPGNRNVFERFVELSGGNGNVTWGDIYDLFDLIIKTTSSNYQLGHDEVYNTSSTRYLANDEIDWREWIRNACGATSSSDFNNNYRNTALNWWDKYTSPYVSYMHCFLVINYIIEGGINGIIDAAQKNCKHNGHYAGINPAGQTDPDWTPFQAKKRKTPSKYMSEASGVDDTRTAYRSISKYSLRYMVLKIACRIAVNFINGMLDDNPGLIHWHFILKPSAYKVAEAMSLEHQIVESTQTTSSSVTTGGGMYSNDHTMSTTSGFNADETAALIIAQRDAVENSIEKPEIRLSITGDAENRWSHALKEFYSQFGHKTYMGGGTIGNTTARSWKISEGYLKHEPSTLDAGMSSKTDQEIEQALGDYYTSILDTLGSTTMNITNYEAGLELI